MSGTVIETERFSNLEEFFSHSLKTDPYSIDVYARVPSGVPPLLEQHAAAMTATFQLAAMKRIIVQIDRVVVSALMHENICNPSTCPRMIASEEWHFLCAPHAEKPRDCCAVDYMQHTVDSCASTLLLASEKPAGTAMKQFNSISRRLFRIYGHVYHHHVEFFNRVDVSNECAKFFIFIKNFGLWKADMAIVPEDVLNSLTSSLKPSIISVKVAAPVVEQKAVGTIVDLRTVAMQLSLEEDSDDAKSDHTVILG